MVGMNTMATRSSLEVMLEKLQQGEDKPEDSPPILPVRPVSRARLPRPRRPLQLDSQTRKCEQNCSEKTKEEDYTESCHQAETNGGRAELCENSKERGIPIIQKCYRGHQVRCYYKELRRGTLVLQSFIRGENARKGLLQHQPSGCRHPSDIKHEPKSDQIEVPYSVIVELQKQVLRSEAKVRGKDEENVALRRRLEDIAKKWRSYEERMRSMEKEWQDQFTYIQECLAAAKNNHNRNGDTIAIQINSVYEQRETVNGEDSRVTEARDEQSQVELHPRDELRKLKYRFKAWKKEYRCKLRDAQSTLKKLGNSESEKRRHYWWGR